MDQRAEKSRQAVGRLFVQHSEAIRGFILSLEPDFTIASDVLQETFLTVSAKAEDFAEGTNFVAWACRIAMLHLLEQQRHSRSSALLAPDVLESLAAAAPCLEPDEERYDAMKRCVAKLAARARQIIDMRYAQALKPGDIALKLRMQPESVYVTLSRARTFLRDCIERQLRGADK